MKAVFYFLVIIFLYGCKTTKSQLAIYQTYDYNGVKKINEFFIKDSLLFLFSNGDMSGCMIDVLRYSHTINDTSYYTIDKRNYSLLCQTVQGKSVQDSIEFYVRSFCRYDSFYLDELLINEKPYKLIDNKVKVSKRNVLAAMKKDSVSIKFYNLGTYLDNFSIGEKDSLINIFFHLNTSSALRRKMYDYISIKVPNNEGSNKSIVIGDETIFFRKIKPAKSYFAADIIH